MKTSKIFSIALAISTIAFGNNASAKPLKVFILVGQSNMQGHAHVRTFEHIGMDPQTAPLLERIQNNDGTPRVCENVWISSLSTNGEKTGRLTVGFGADENKIGPELMFGITVQKKLNEPILIIKTAWGGKSLHTDFRPPSAGPYQFNNAQLEQIEKKGSDLATIRAEKDKATGHYYRLTMNHVEKVLADIKRVYPAYDASQGYQLGGMVWFQGWNDMVDQSVYPNRDQQGGYQAYSDLLAHFIRDVRKDLGSPDLPFVIGVMGVNGPIETYAPEQKRYQSTHQNFRDAMAAPAKLDDFQGNVSAVLTENYWDTELSSLRAREGSIRQAIKQRVAAEKPSNQQLREIQDDAISKELTPHELKVLQVGVSNAEYHYLGSAKIMAQIGQGFADAVLKLLDQ
ncbi:sialate O-acetylesterase [Neorhodopirellula pilleata]|uniref:Sialate O-acetylesterase domain-containing protein n=1 Tax=Neorhodopirellula pilleata TaxID=2714738 RepID=A0A5C6A973_9BACT|nr:sialate O-acetylesterase [Neorhodopirellula pilleata]TWT95581.1 hypothetical protein Pla100_32220 [Neorhodopirellula pilleata]